MVFVCFLSCFFIWYLFGLFVYLIVSVNKDNIEKYKWGKNYWKRNVFLEIIEKKYMILVF